jgi:hypothetical protein
LSRRIYHVIDIYIFAGYTNPGEKTHVAVWFEIVDSEKAVIIFP